MDCRTRSRDSCTSSIYSTGCSTSQIASYLAYSHVGHDRNRCGYDAVMNGSSGPNNQHGDLVRPSHSVSGEDASSGGRFPLPLNIRRRAAECFALCRLLSSWKSLGRDVARPVIARRPSEQNRKGAAKSRRNEVLKNSARADPCRKGETRHPGGLHRPRTSLKDRLSYLNSSSWPGPGRSQSRSGRGWRARRLPALL